MTPWLLAHDIALRRTKTSRGHSKRFKQFLVHQILVRLACCALRHDSGNYITDVRVVERSARSVFRFSLNDFGDNSVPVTLNSVSLTFAEEMDPRRITAKAC